MGYIHFRIRTRFSLLTGLICWIALASFGQKGYHVSQFTSRDGLPQNSIRGLAFDEFGFLWIATEGGLARYDGNSFKNAGPEEHPELNNQRFTQALTSNDSTALFLDAQRKVYRLSGNQFTLLGNTLVDYISVVEIIGSLPFPELLIQDSLLRKSFGSDQGAWGVFPAGEERLYVVSGHLSLLDRKNNQLKMLHKGPFDGKKFAQLDGQLIFLDRAGQLQKFHPESNAFKPCILLDESGKPWSKKFNEPRFYSRHPFRTAFIQEKNQLYILTATSSPSQFLIREFLDALPEKTKVLSLDYREKDQLLAIGTSSKGLFLYRKKAFQTFINPLPDKDLTNSYYAQALLDSTSLLLSSGLIVDLPTLGLKGRFPHPFRAYQLAMDRQEQLFFRGERIVYRYDPRRPDQTPKPLPGLQHPHSLVSLDSTVWAVCRQGIYQLEGDSPSPVFMHYFRNTRQVISLCKDREGDLWLGSLAQLFRLDLQNQRLDSFPQFQEAETRTLAQIRDMLFIGTYGKGYFVYHNGKIRQMPRGPNSGLSNVHAFIEDKEGFLWMTTNSGLYKTRLDAIDAYLQDTTQDIFYYVYLEEDGIGNSEFNGGCNPSYLWLPDGRLSLPTIEGMVFFDPSRADHLFPTDSLLFTRMEVDGASLPMTKVDEIPADHFDIRVHYATAWWGQPPNLNIEYRLEGLQSRFQRLEPDQRVIRFGSLKPGTYTLVLRKRIGFGSSDFAFASLPMTVLPPWHTTPMAFVFYAVGFLLILWGTSVLHSRSVRHRNFLLQQKVTEQTAELRKANALLGQNVEKLHQSERALRENLETKDRLISIITHDILTPLRFIGMIARLGGEDDTGASQMQKALEDVQIAVNKLYYSALNVIHWVRFQKDSFELRLTNCSPFVLVEKLTQEFSEMAAYQGNVLLNEVPEDDIILTDPQRLTIILNNLLSNAIKFTREGKIYIRSHMEPGWYLLEVRDTGRGMSQQQIQALRQGKSWQEENRPDQVTAGTGMGLSLVSDLVKALDGRWEIESSEGKGLKVQLFLPVPTTEKDRPAPFPGSRPKMTPQKTEFQ